MRHVWLVPLEKRQQGKAHGDKQQGHLDDAGHASVFHPRRWIHVFTHEGHNLIVDRVVSRRAVRLQKINHQLFDTFRLHKPEQDWADQ